MNCGGPAPDACPHRQLFGRLFNIHPPRPDDSLRATTPWLAQGRRRARLRRFGNWNLGRHDSRAQALIDKIVSVELPLCARYQTLRDARYAPESHHIAMEGDSSYRHLRLVVLRFGALLAVRLHLQGRVRDVELLVQRFRYRQPNGVRYAARLQDDMRRQAEVATRDWSGPLGPDREA